MKKLIRKHKDLLSEGDLKWFKLNGLKNYILPSLNLMPKVHKLMEEASIENESELKGRPIVTGHSWCTVEASKFVQKELRKILEKFKLKGVLE